MPTINIKSQKITTAYKRYPAVKAPPIGSGPTATAPKILKQHRFPRIRGANGRR